MFICLYRSPNSFAQDFAGPDLKPSMSSLLSVINPPSPFPSTLQVSNAFFWYTLQTQDLMHSKQALPWGALPPYHLTVNMGSCPLGFPKTLPFRCLYMKHDLTVVWRNLSYKLEAPIWAENKCMDPVLYWKPEISDWC